jgi:hypothetical protein
MYHDYTAFRIQDSLSTPIAPTRLVKIIRLSPPSQRVVHLAELPHLLTCQTKRISTYNPVLTSTSEHKHEDQGQGLRLGHHWAGPLHGKGSNRTIRYLRNNSSRSASRYVATSTSCPSEHPIQP